MSAQFKFVRLLSQKALSTFGLFFFTTFPVMAGGIDITSYGHSSLLIKGGGQSVLLNPFKAVGCASGLNEPRVAANVILASSQLADEGARIAKGTYLVEPGAYRIGSLRLEGFSSPHDRLGGRRFGDSTVWKWEQGGLNFAHLGGAVAPLTPEEKVLLGRPDVLIIAVGGGPKAYDGLEAAKVVRDLNPKTVIPVNYLRGKPPSGCEQTGVQPFLEAMEGIEVREVGETFNLPSEIDHQIIINVMS